MERQAAQRNLRAAIALWAGWQREMGREDSETYRRFFFKYGTDILSAQALGEREANELRERIAADLNSNNVREIASE
jgi:DNA repair protein RadD